MPISIQDIIKDENIANAMNFLMTKKDSCGIDGMKLSELPDYWKANGRKIINSILKRIISYGGILFCYHVSRETVGGRGHEIFIENMLER